jgi:cytochrome oxidase Cu insertion factor (SCO1/SenC/PrrC family)
MLRGNDWGVIYLVRFIYISCKKILQVINSQLKKLKKAMKDIKEI